MALEDLAMMRAMLGATVLYPRDAVSAERLVEAAARTPGHRLHPHHAAQDARCSTATTRPSRSGGSKTLRSSAKDQVTLVGAGITLHEALAAHEVLAQEGIAARVIDLYSLKPLDADTLRRAAAETRGIVTVEDHSVHGGIGEAVAGVPLAGRARVERLGVREIPRSGKPAELMKACGIGADGIVEAARRLL